MIWLIDIARFIFRPLYWLAGKVFSIWARPTVQPDVPADLYADVDAEICYVLETGGLADVLALERACAEHGLPSPRESFEFSGKRFARRLVVLRPRKGFMFRRPATGGSPRLRSLVEAGEGSEEDLQLVPVAIYWGRSPEREDSIFKLLFAESWDVAGRTRKFFATVLHGRNTLMRFSHALPLNSIIQEKLGADIAFRKLSRILRVHFRKRRTATVGPDLSNRRRIARLVAMAPNVRRAIEAEAGDDPKKLAAAERKAQKYVMEIAADVSWPAIRIAVRILRRLWQQVYDGIELGHTERLREVAKEKVVVYVPCHRSHFDYLLLSYICYEQGVQLPHIAAGINLNMPVVGPILRRGGAFFLRRSFRGNRLYAAVFDAYLNQLLTRGYTIEYFVEGGRSRTGRLLSPKGGMLAMTVGSYIQNPRRSVVFVPVYFGYEKLIEGGSFISELGGAEKQKESLLGLVRSVKTLRENFGRVYVNIGEPIELDEVLESVQPGWRNLPTGNGERPTWVNEVVDTLGGEIMGGINAAAAVTPISLLAYVLLSTPKQTIGAAELRAQLQLSLDLLQRFHYSDSVTVPDWSPDEIIAHGEKLQAISRVSHPMGDVIHMTESTAVLLTYFRNNILHLLSVPASAACCFIQGRELPLAELQRLVRLIYPFMRKELCLKWPEDAVDKVTKEAVDALVEQGLLIRHKRRKLLERPRAGSAKAYQLMMLGQTMVPMLQRFYLVIAILVQHGSGTLTRSSLEQRCQLSAERLSMIYELHSPDFFNKTLFHDFIRKLQDQDVLRRNEDGLLEFDEDIVNIGTDARLVLGEQIRHSILSLTVPGDNSDI
jgi:glycerol-3-phosphate O-acyltransferase